VEIAIAVVVVVVLVVVQVRRRRSPLQRPGEPRETHRRS
jgi:heme exporter protein D